MPTKTKPWTKQDIIILSEAYKLGIALKVIASALNRTVLSINHILSRKGIRTTIKQDKLSPYSLSAKQRRDNILMSEILKSHGLKIQTLSPKLSSLCTEGASQSEENSSYSLHIQMSSVEKLARIQGETVLHASCRTVEKWALHNKIPFSKVETFAQALRHNYLIKGLPHSPSQFLLIVNRQRLSQGLLPFHVAEWENE